MAEVAEVVELAVVEVVEIAEETPHPRTSLQACLSSDICGT